VNRDWRGTRGGCLGWACIVAIVAANGGGRARADTHCDAPKGAEPHVAAIDGRARLEWIDRRLSHEAPRMSLWNWSWAVGIGASGVGTLIAVPFVSPESRPDYYTGALAAAIGVLPFLVAPPLVIQDAHDLHANLISAPPTSDRAVCALLSHAEDMLVRDARNERLMSAWWAHLGNLVYNAGIVAFEGLVFDRWKGGLINGVIGLAVGEVVIFTQPTQVIHDLGAYNRGDIGPGP
jgi:hypothetical protein